MKLSTKMFLLGGAAISALVILFGINFYEGKVVKEANELSALRGQQLAITTEMKLAQVELALAAMDSIVDKNSGDVSAERLAIINKSATTLQEGLEKVREAADNDQEKDLAQAMNASVNNLVDGIKTDLVALIKRMGTANKPSDEDFGRIDNIIDQFGSNLHDQLFQYAASIQAEVDEANTALAQSLKTASIIGTSVFLSALVALTAIITLITLSIIRPINAVVKNMIGSTEQVSGAAGQISESSQTLAEGASEQAAAIEETSASMEEMTSMTRQNSDNANQADSLMRDTLEIIRDADRSMDEMTKSMEEISQASEETSKIVKTIDEIAFQTNLLALNAAVEAARAGEAGAGFAVVADEVRNLAMRAAEAAKNTAQLIEGTVAKVDFGKNVVSKTNSAFKEVAESSTKIGDLVGEISVASKEQATGFSQISQAITQMDTVTQQNSASAEESAAASADLNSQAEIMMDVVASLRAIVEEDRSGAPRQQTAEKPTRKKKINIPALSWQH